MILNIKNMICKVKIFLQMEHTKQIPGKIITIVNEERQQNCADEC